MKTIQITNYTYTTAAGIGRAQNWQAITAGRSGLGACTFFDVADREPPLNTWAGEVEGLELLQLPTALMAFDCRNNRLCELGLLQDGFIDSVNAAVERYGASRVAVFMGTSTSGIHHTELAYMEAAAACQHAEPVSPLPALPQWYHYRYSHNVYSLAEYVRQRLNLEGLSEVISTACSSSAKVFASASRAIELGLCDAAIVGGVDSLCLTTLYGFNALQVVSSDICKPSDQNRKGLSLGEAAGFALVEAVTDSSKPQLKGYGESSDAYHMSSPHPEGLGAQKAMEQALQRAKIDASRIDYVNLHGTGTSANDLAESNAVVSLLGSVPASSTKGWTGHTLGAAGIVESAIALQCIENGWLPQSLNTECVDSAIHANIQLQPSATHIDYVLTNSFGFGGSNCSLIFAAGDA